MDKTTIYRVRLDVDGGTHFDGGVSDTYYSRYGTAKREMFDTVSVIMGGFFEAYSSKEVKSEVSLDGKTETCAIRARNAAEEADSCTVTLEPIEMVVG